MYFLKLLWGFDIFLLGTRRMTDLLTIDTIAHDLNV